MPKEGELIAGKYRLQRCLGTGAMGSVWAAWHLELDAPVAIKFELPSAQGTRSVNNSKREARAAARLRSPHVVRVYDFGLQQDAPFIVMELLEGQSLKTRLENGPPPTPTEAADIVAQAASALDAAHAERLVHRDIKPSNVFLMREGEREVVKVLDFGIAKWLDSDVHGEARTESSRLVGSAAYMSPEQARGQAVDACSDVWSLAVLAYELLTSERPFPGSNIPEILSKICAIDHLQPSTRLGAAYAELDAVFAKGLQRDKARRYQSAGEFARTLSAAVRRLPAPDERIVPLTTAAKTLLGRSSETASLSVVSVNPSAKRSPRKALGYLLMLSAGGAGAGLFFSRERIDTESPTAAQSLAVMPHESNAPKVEASIPAPPNEPTLEADSAPSGSVSSNADSANDLDAPFFKTEAAPLRTVPAPRRQRGAPTPVTSTRSTAVSVPAVTHSQVDPIFGLEVPAQ